MEERLNSRYRARARKLRLDALLLSHALTAGQFRSLAGGVHGVDFAGVREYTIFDDARLIDWNVTARSQKTYVKLLEEDRDCQMFVIIDDSLSMFTGSVRARREAATEAAILLCMAADMADIRMGGAIFNSEVTALVAPNTRGDFLAAVKANAANSEAGAMVSLRPFGLRGRQVPTGLLTNHGANHTGAGSCLDRALLTALSMLKMRSFVVVLSDFRCASSLYEKPLAALAKCHDVVTLCVTDKIDAAFPRLGTIRFCDAESKAKSGGVLLPTSSRAFASRWKRAGQERLAAWKTLCARRGAKMGVLSTDEDVLESLMRVFARCKGWSPSRQSGAGSSVAERNAVSRSIHNGG